MGDRVGKLLFSDGVGGFLIFILTLGQTLYGRLAMGKRTNGIWLLVLGVMHHAS